MRFERGLLISQSDLRYRARRVATELLRNSNTSYGTAVTKVLNGIGIFNQSEIRKHLSALSAEVDRQREELLAEEAQLLAEMDEVIALCATEDATAEMQRNLFSGEHHILDEDGNDMTASLAEMTREDQTNRVDYRIADDGQLEMMLDTERREAA